MVLVALKGLAGRKLRAVLTAVAIILGVAMISGTYVLTDTIQSAFGTVFTSVYKHTDAVISGKSAIGTNNNSNALPPSFSQSLLGRVRQLPGVAEAEGGIADYAYLVGRDGKVISGHGAPPLAFSVHPHGDQRFNPLTLVSGTWPVGSHQVDIDAHTASKHDYKVGDAIGVVARGAKQTYRVAGIVQIGGVSSLGGATMAIFDFPTAQRIFHKEGRLDSISIASKSGTRPEQLVQEIKPLLPPTAQVRTAEAQAKQATKDTNGFLSIIRDFLLAFAGVALFVGTFVIANTLSITIAQRTRELATLRTLGATRRQVLGSVLVEAFVIGVLASVAGLFLGLALAKGLNSLFISFGIDLPQAGTVFATRTIVVSLLVGTFVTVLAALRPAVRATRVPPIAAVREGAVLPESRFARFSAHTAVVVIGGSIALMLVGLFVGGLSTTQRLLAIGVGAAAVFLGVAMLAKTLVPPLARVLGWPAATLGGAPGTLARGNAMRNPQRTASTASALMIGLALVTVVSVLASGLKTTFENAVNSVFRGDYAVTATDNFSPISIASTNALKDVPGVTVVSGVRAGDGKAFGHRIGVTGVAPDITKVITVNWQVGSQAVPGELGRNGAFVAKNYANDHHLSVGSPIAVETPSGKTMHLRPSRDLRAAEGRLAVRRRHRLGAALRRRVPEPAERLHVRQHDRRSHRREHGEAEAGAEAVPRGEGRNRERVQEEPGAGDRHAAQPPLRPSLALDRHQPVRDREHARPHGLRAHARARDAARRRHDPAPGAPDDPPREHRHGAHRRCTRHPRRCRARAHGRQGDQVSGVHDPVRDARRIRDRRDHRRSDRSHLPGAPRGEAQRARCAPVRVARGSVSVASRRARARAPVPS